MAGSQRPAREFRCSAVRPKASGADIALRKLLRIGGIVAFNEHLISRWFVGMAPRHGQIMPVVRTRVFSTDGHTEPIETEHLFGYHHRKRRRRCRREGIRGVASPADLRNRTEPTCGASTISVEFVPIANLRTEFTAVGQHLRHRRRRAGSPTSAIPRSAAVRRHPLPAARSRDRAVRFCDRRRAALGPGRRDHRRTRQPIWRRFRRGGRLGDRSRSRRRGVQPALSARNHAFEPDRHVVAGIHRGRCVRRDGAGPSGDFCRRRSALSAPVRRGRAGQLRRAGVFHRADDLRQALRKSLDARWPGARRSRATRTAIAGSLDLVNFERQQARLLFGVDF